MNLKAPCFPFSSSSVSLCDLWGLLLLRLSLSFSSRKQRSVLGQLLMFRFSSKSQVGHFC
ncbi:hypothetical protein Plhal710r2_c014g0065081 [Plasmopara halstedii]